MGKEVRRAQMPAWTLKCVTGTCDAEGDWASVSFAMRWSSQGATCPSTRIREIAPFGRGKLFFV